MPRSELWSSRESRRVGRIRDRFLAGHDDELENVRPVVRQSWLRSRGHRVDPAMRAAPIIPAEPSARMLREHDALKHAALPVLRFLSEALDRSLVILADAQCRPIHLAGGGRTLDEAAQINVVVGSQWSEDQVGTDALAVSTVLDQPVQIHWSEHFSDFGERWTGNAAPIHHLGRKLGTLSVYGYDEIAHPRALELVSECAAMIEQRCAADEQRMRLVLFDRYDVHQARYPHDSLLCVSALGAVVAASRGALDLLGLSHEQAIGQALRQLPGLHQEGLLALEELRQPTELRLDTRLGVVRAAVLPVAHDETVIGFLATLSPLRRTGAPAVTTGGWSTRFGFADVVGQSPAIRGAVAEAERLATRELPVLVRGESGTGKELFAQAMHRASQRSHAPFVPLNCGGTSEELLGAELFGYADGAFTGAARGGRAGLFELADRGTLFLDEVETMPVRMQAHLLRTLEDGRVVRLGGDRPRRVDVRVIAATKGDLAASVTDGRFRADLYHRLNVLRLLLPPLRERPGDAAILARHLLTQHGVATELDDDACAWLDAQPWPGNVRELRNVLLQAAERAGPTLTMHDLAGTSPPTDVAGRSRAGGLRAAERQAIVAALRECNGNVSRAAARLGVHRVTLHRKLRRHGITLPRRPE